MSMQEPQPSDRKSLDEVSKMQMSRLAEMRRWLGERWRMEGRVK